LANVAPKARTSGRNPRAEKRRRSAAVAPAARLGAQPAISAFEWNIGIDR
jgi:hypothetical protein